MDAIVYNKLAGILRDAGYRVIAPGADDQLDPQKLGEDIQGAFNDIDHLAFGDTWDEATQRCVEAGKYLLNFYQIRPK